MKGIEEDHIHCEERINLSVPDEEDPTDPEYFQDHNTVPLGKIQLHTLDQHSQEHLEKNRLS